MTKVRREISVARRRLTIQKGLQWLPWSILISFSVAFVALLIPKLTYLPFTFESWSQVWLAGAAGCSIGIPTCLALLSRPSLQSAAVEVDKRFGLQERLSSLLMLPKESPPSEAASALQLDAEAKIDRIDVRDGFPLRFSRVFPWVVLPVLACATLYWVPDAELPRIALSEDTIQRIHNAKQRTKPILSQVKALRETSEGLKKLEQRIEELQNKKEMQPKELLSDFNAIKKELEQRKDSLHGQDELKKAMESLKELEKGPGEKFGESMKAGDLSKASAELQDIQKQLAEGNMSKEQMEQFSKQLAQLDQAIKDKLDQQREKLQQLKDELSKAESSGDIEQAAALRKQIEQAENAIQRSAQASQAAQSLANAAKAMQNGDSQAAQQALSDLQKEIESMAASDAAMQELEQMMQSIENAKQASNCRACQGGGCSACQNSASNSSSGNRSGSQSGNRPGEQSPVQSTASGSGEGIGKGSSINPPGEEIETSPYDSRVTGQNRNLEQQFGGKVRGVNRPGMSLEEARAIIDNAAPEDPDAAEGIPLPRAEREQQREYFERLRSQ